MAKAIKTTAQPSKTGRPPCFAAPQDLWSMFEAYVEVTGYDPILKEDYVGKDADRVMREIQRPLTLEGFEIYCFKKFGFGSDLGDYFRVANLDSEQLEQEKNTHYAQFSAVSALIRKCIRNNQIEGGMAGIYNQSITQRLNNLVEKVESKNDNTNRNFDLTMDLK